MVAMYRSTGASAIERAGAGAIGRNAACGSAVEPMEDSADRTDSASSDVAGRVRQLYSMRHMAGEVRLVSDDSQDLEGIHLGVALLQSPVLAAMLRSSMRESRSLQIRVQADFAQIIPHLVRFMYGLPIPLEENFHHVLTLWRAARYYELEELRSACTKALIAFEPSIPRMVALVREPGIEEGLASVAWSYLEARPYELFRSPEWLRLPTCVLRELLKRDSLCCRELDVLRALSRRVQTEGSANPAATGSVPEPPQTGLDQLPQELLDLIRFENMSPRELRAAKRHLPVEAYVSVLEQACGAVPRKRARSKRDSVPRTWRCLVCGAERDEGHQVEGVGSASDGEEETSGANVGVDCTLAPCKWAHTGQLVREVQCVDHRNRCPTCMKCNRQRWSCCLQGKAAPGCVRRAHQWQLVPAAEARQIDSANSS